MTGRLEGDRGTVSGRDLSRRFYERAVRPLVSGVPHAAALLGEGSEVLGFDDEISTDHDFGPRVQLFVPPGFDATPIDAALRGLPARFDGFPVVAAGWLRVSQEEPFVGRTGGRGDDLGSRMLVARVARDLVRIGFLLERRWAPYGKWLTAAFAQLTLADQIGEHLHHALRATRWLEREAALCVAASHLAAATNRLGLAEPVDPAPRRFHSRDIHVLGGERLTRALTDAISDPPLRTLLTRLGHRPDGPLGHLPGAIDQATDSVEILTQPIRRRDYAPALGLRA
ncbi:hypothetical protein FDG2_0415 [Candidatus Protofrankia californiensis]|uniref:DUF4037 domain-containing protein n=1 Tax=Candidatus Protofrankia californiensis TaxID=1839754 RepID=A0A1C3NTI6_9ACTN|nr:hypothetical protein FDG2_0415 [Candidatus Protofrankia californiensis]